MTRRRLACAALAAALAAAPLAGCGDDEPDPSAQSAAEETTSTVSDPELTTEEPSEPSRPEIAPEGHEGGGPDPGSQEAESAAGHSGGTEAEDRELEVEPAPEDGGGANGSGGASPTDAFDQFCEENPGACD